LDDDFTPEGKLKYNSKRYQNKLEKLSQVLSSIDSLSLPTLIGLCEIENREVIEDLCKEQALINADYKIAHTESPDKRGIDCALIYKSKDFIYLNHNVLNIEFPWEPDYKTRDILHVKGILGKSDTINIFVNHWPSRRGGQEESEKNRVFVAEQLRKSIDQIQIKNSLAKIIVMGDFNDEPNNVSVTNSLKATNNKSSENQKELYNLMYDLFDAGHGSYNYRGDWNMLDHLIVSQSLINSKNGISTTFDAGRIYNKEWICFKNKSGDSTPNRTYLGSKYCGGYSDHFPVYFKLSE
jgi:exonuclease III